jgi:hypothetical protein
MFLYFVKHTVYRKIFKIKVAVLDLKYIFHVSTIAMSVLLLSYSELFCRSLTNFYLHCVIIRD